MAGRYRPGPHAVGISSTSACGQDSAGRQRSTTPTGGWGKPLQGGRLRGSPKRIRQQLLVGDDPRGRVGCDHRVYQRVGGRTLGAAQERHRDAQKLRRREPRIDRRRTRDRRVGAVRREEQSLTEVGFGVGQQVPGLGVVAAALEDGRHRRDAFQDPPIQAPRWPSGISRSSSLKYGRRCPGRAAANDSRRATWGPPSAREALSNRAMGTCGPAAVAGRTAESPNEIGRAPERGPPLEKALYAHRWRPRPRAPRASPDSSPSRRRRAVDLHRPERVRERQIARPDADHDGPTRSRVVLQVSASAQSFTSAFHFGHDEEGDADACPKPRPSRLDGCSCFIERDPLACDGPCSDGVEVYGEHSRTCAAAGRPPFPARPPGTRPPAEADCSPAARARETRVPTSGRSCATPQETRRRARDRMRPNSDWPGRWMRAASPTVRLGLTLLPATPCGRTVRDENHDEQIQRLRCMASGTEGPTRFR